VGAASRAKVNVSCQSPGGHINTYRIQPAALWADIRTKGRSPPAPLPHGYDIDAKSPFKVPGERIDGAFTLKGTEFPLEATWRAAMILMDGSDLGAVIEGRVALPELLSREQQYAAPTGSIFLRAHEILG
jgi:hypothetical protein